MKRSSMRVCLLVLACLAGLVNCRADELAAVTGLVTDPNGRSVPGVNVLITNLSTNVVSRTVTNDQGVYRVPSLQPGIYRMTLDKDGFKSVVKSGVELHIQDVASINFELQIGSVNETVTVEAGGLVINTTDAAVSTVVDRAFAENLPLNGRSFQSLIYLTPGVVATSSNYFDNGQFSVNGQRADANYWMVDGVSANIGTGVNSTGFAGNGIGGSLGSFSAMGGTNSLVSVDAMQEFRIQTSTYSPEFGRTPGGQISIVTRSGTNSWHGTAFDYLRNDIFDANNWFNTAVVPALPKSKERQNDFGGTLGGPILKERTFFFFSYEGLRLRLPQTTLTTVPCDSTCQVFGNARANAVSAMQPYLNAYPLPNGKELFTPCTPNVNGCPTSGQQPTGAAQFNASYSNPATLDAYSLRIDHKLNDKVSFFGRYNYSPSNITQRGGGTFFALSTIGATEITTQTGTAGATWSITPMIANDLRFNYSRVAASGQESMDSFGGAVPLASLPFPGSFTAENGLFALDIFSLKQGSLELGRSQRNLQRQINIIDSLSMQKGSHSLKFGGDFRRLSPVYSPPAYQQTANFSTVSSSTTGSLSYGFVAANESPTFGFRNLGLYAQDTWRVLSRLTLTYGLRWDVDFVPQSLNGPRLVAVTGFNLNNLSSLAIAPAGTQPYETKYGNFAPRVGLAYRLFQTPNWQTVLRGGFGVFYDLASSQIGNQASGANYPFGGIAYQFGGTFPFAPSMTTPPSPTPPNATNSQALYAVDPHLQLPYTLEWNVAFEQELGSQQAVSASYIGATGRRLLQSAVTFSPNPNFGQAVLVSNAGSSYYNALQVQFQRRLSHGLQALASYTWSHSIDTGSAGSYAVVSNVFVPSAAYANRGSSDFDIRNAFSAGITYDLPEIHGNAFTRAILHGWSTENTIQARSAPPVLIQDVSFSFLYGVTYGNVRPDVIPGQPPYLYGSQYPGGKAINPAAFTNPPSAPMGPGCPFGGCPTRQGTLPRNSLRGFGATQWDLAVHRDFPIRESLKLQFRAELFNVLNHPNFGPPYPYFGFGGFGVSTQMLGQSLNNGNLGGGAFSPLYQIGGPRSVQLALKLFF